MLICAISTFVIASLIQACGPSVKKVDKVIIKTWSETIPLVDNQNGKSLVPKTSKSTHELWTESKQIPSLKRIEVTLAAAGVLAESNGSEGQYNMSVGQGQCKSEWLPLDQHPTINRQERANTCLSQLDAKQQQRFSAMQAVMKISCQGLSGGGAIDLHNMVVAVSKAIETPNAVEGEKAKQEHPSPVWVELTQERCGPIKKLNQYLTQDHIRFNRFKIDAKYWAVWTKGLQNYGIQEISFLMVEKERLAKAESKLLAAADMILRTEGLQVGQSISSGIANGMYIPVKTAQKELLKTKSLPDSLLKSLTIVNPKAKVSDLQALRKLTRRFTVR